MNILQNFKPITTFVFDIDGVLTDGNLWLMPAGVMLRRMNVKDGYALQFAIKQGYKIIIISGGDSPDAEERLKKLGVTNVFMKVQDKVKVLTNYLKDHAAQWSDILYMGDDIPDYEVMQLAGMACCPADAIAEIKNICKYISPKKGGQGCVRDVIEKVLKLSGNWDIDTHIPTK